MSGKPTFKTYRLKLHIVTTRKYPTSERVITGERDTSADVFAPIFFDDDLPLDIRLYHLSIYYAGAIALRLGESEKTPIYTNRLKDGSVCIWYYVDREHVQMVRVVVAGYDTY